MELPAINLIKKAIRRQLKREGDSNHREWVKMSTDFRMYFLVTPSLYDISRCGTFILNLFIAIVVDGISVFKGAELKENNAINTDKKETLESELVQLEEQLNDVIERAHSVRQAVKDHRRAG